MDKRYLFYGGIISFLLYLGADVVFGLLTPDYVFREHAVSELMLADAEYRTYVSAVIFSSSLAGLAFGVGFLLHFPYSRSRLLFVAGVLLVVSSLSTSLTSTVFPQDARDAEATFEGTMHLTLVGMNVLITIIVMLLCGTGFNAEFGWKGLRLLSFIALVLMAVGGVVSTMFIQNDIDWLGVSERVSIYAYFGWVSVMAWMLLEHFKDQDGTGP